MPNNCPAPPGAGGLKFHRTQPQGLTPKSRPTRGGWIEIIQWDDPIQRPASRPTRGGWIEINVLLEHIGINHVPPHPGRVD